jgi:hypothetical protein
LTSKNWLVKVPSFDNDDDGNVVFTVVLVPNHHDRELKKRKREKE